MLKPVWGVCLHIEGRWETGGKLDQEKKKNDDRENLAPDRLTLWGLEVDGKQVEVEDGEDRGRLQHSVSIHGELEQAAVWGGEEKQIKSGWNISSLLMEISIANENRPAHELLQEDCKLNEGGKEEEKD